MEVKVLELRDEATFIPILCIDMNPRDVDSESSSTPRKTIEAQFQSRLAQGYLLRRCGYPCDNRPNILMTRLDGNGQATNDPYGWKGGTRTFPVAHNWIIANWSSLKDGDVVDVQFILGETKFPKVSERGSFNER